MSVQTWVDQFRSNRDLCVKFNEINSRLKERFGTYNCRIHVHVGCILSVEVGHISTSKYAAHSCSCQMDHNSKRGKLCHRETAPENHNLCRIITHDAVN